MRAKLEPRAATRASLPAALWSFCCGTQWNHPHGWPCQSASQCRHSICRYLLPGSCLAGAVQSVIHDSVDHPLACVHIYEAPAPQVARALWPRPCCGAGRHLHSFVCPCTCKAAAGGSVGFPGRSAHHHNTTQPTSLHKASQGARRGARPAAAARCLSCVPCACGRTWC